MNEEQIRKQAFEIFNTLKGDPDHEQNNNQRHLRKRMRENFIQGYVTYWKNENFGPKPTLHLMNRSRSEGLAFDDDGILVYVSFFTIDKYTCARCKQKGSHGWEHIYSKDCYCPACVEVIQ